MSDRLNQAITFAVKSHGDQMRKMERIPYIMHPMEVSAIIASMTEDQDLMIAGLLHDVVEDTKVDAKTVREKFGDNVASLVQSETEDKREELPPEQTWQIRKEESLQELKESKDIRVKMLWLADKLSNMRSLFRNYQRIGDGIFQAFHEKDKKKQEWYYRSVAENLTELKDTAAYQEYVFLVDKVFK